MKQSVDKLNSVIPVSTKGKMYEIVSPKSHDMPYYTPLTDIYE